MKNQKLILLAAFALISTTAMAHLVQPMNPVSEDSPVRISIGAKGDVGPDPDTKGKFGMGGVGGALGFTHNAGYDFEYGLGLGYEWTSPYGRIFSQNSKPQEGSRISAELILRYMPELADRFHLGLNVGLGWGRQFGGDAAKKINESTKFGDMNLKVGPAMSYGFSDSVGMYMAANYSLHNIRFGVAENGAAKSSANWSGVDLPLGFWFTIADNTGLFVEANSRFYNIAKDAKYFKEEITLGMSFAI